MPTLNPSTDALLQQAIAAARMQRPAEAERLAAEVLAADPANVLAAHLAGAARLMLGRPADAVAPLRIAVAGGDDPVNETLLARALAAAGRRVEAIEQLRRTTARRPPYLLAFLELGEQLGAAGRVDEGVAVFEAGLALDPHADGLKIGLGYLCLQRKDRGRARALFAEVRAAAPDRLDALVGLARTLAVDGDHAGAAELYRRVLDRQPDDAASRIGLGKSLLELGERDAGEAQLRAAAAAGQVGPALTALSATPHGRMFLRRSAAERFLTARP